jgi:hypothetical protein
MRGLVGVIAFIVVVSACDGLESRETTVMCDVASRLSAAYATTSTAADRIDAGDSDGAHTLGATVRVEAEEAHALLQTIRTQDVRHGPAWGSLLEAYLHVGQAANAAIGDFGGVREELGRARPSLVTAAESLPRCFTPPSA